MGYVLRQKFQGSMPVDCPLAGFKPLFFSCFFKATFLCLVVFFCFIAFTSRGVAFFLLFLFRAVPFAACFSVSWRVGTAVATALVGGGYFYAPRLPRAL